MLFYILKDTIKYNHRVIVQNVFGKFQKERAVVEKSAQVWCLVLGRGVVGLMLLHCDMKLQSSADCFPSQVTTVCGISTLPSPGSAGTSRPLEDTPTTSPSLANQPEPPAPASRSEVTTLQLTGSSDTQSLSLPECLCLSPQMLSPYSKGLFRRVITQCGVALSPWALQRNPMALTKKVHTHSAVQPLETI